MHTILAKVTSCWIHDFFCHCPTGIDAILVSKSGVLKCIKEVWFWVEIFCMQSFCYLLNKYSQKSKYWSVAFISTFLWWWNRLQELASGLSMHGRRSGSWRGAVDLETKLLVCFTGIIPSYLIYLQAIVWHLLPFEHLQALLMNRSVFSLRNTFAVLWIIKALFGSVMNLVLCAFFCCSRWL